MKKISLLIILTLFSLYCIAQTDLKVSHTYSKKLKTYYMTIENISQDEIIIVFGTTVPKPTSYVEFYYNKPYNRDNITKESAISWDKILILNQQKSKQYSFYLGGEDFDKAQEINLYYSIVYYKKGTNEILRKEGGAFIDSLQ